MLTKWIDEGAKFDGPDPNALLTALVPGVLQKGKNASMEPKLEVMAATGKETVRFARDIAPVLVENCLGCHGAGEQSGRQAHHVDLRQLAKGRR